MHNLEVLHSKLSPQGCLFQMDQLNSELELEMQRGIAKHSGTQKDICSICRKDFRTVAQLWVMITFYLMTLEFESNNVKMHPKTLNQLYLVVLCRFENPN